MMRRLVLVAVLILLTVPLASCGTDDIAKTSTSSPAPGQSAGDAPGEFTVDDTSGSASEASGDAAVVAEGAGLSYNREYDAINYGVVLKNTSADDAIDVEVIVDFLDKSGTVVASETAYINVIPAGTEYFLGGETYAEDGKPSKIETEVSVGSSEAAAYELPKISDVKVSKDYFGDEVIKGKVTNQFEEPLSDMAGITVVLFNSGGKVIGGGFTYLDNRLKPGRSASFEISMSAQPTDKISKVGASMNNEIQGEY